MRPARHDATKTVAESHPKGKPTRAIKSGHAMTPPHSNREKPPDPLTDDEIKWIRETRSWVESQREQSEKRTWLVKVVLPWVLSVVSGTALAFEWLSKHFTLR